MQKMHEKRTFHETIIEKHQQSRLPYVDRSQIASQTRILYDKRNNTDLNTNMKWFNLQFVLGQIFDQYSSVSPFEKWALRLINNLKSICRHCLSSK